MTFLDGGVKIGKNCRINCNILTAESYMINIGDDVTIADHVSFITHDNSISKVLPDKTDLFGKIVIGNNSFIGAHSVIMYGVTLPEKTIVAAGSVVTKSFSENEIIIGGNPAKIIGRWSQFGEKNREKAFKISGWTKDEKEKHLLFDDKLIKR